MAYTGRLGGNQAFVGEFRENKSLRMPWPQTPSGLGFRV